MCDLCPSGNTKLSDQELLDQKGNLSYCIGPLAVLWISSFRDKDHFCWKLIKDRLYNCFTNVHELVSMEFIHLVDQLIFGM